MGRTFFGVHCTLVVCDALFWDVAVISCASVRDRIHSSSSNIFVVGSSSFFRKMSCISDRSQHSSERSLVIHLNVRICENIEDSKKSSFFELHLQRQ